ncbi:MAG: hypothetical protein HY889_01445 [Deltaproteobacteria bacterium]|nr:hypothetical protein [Deltaproteobacteria bacterium]
MLKIKAAAVAKITRPSYLKVLDRKRLFTLLDRCRKRQAVWIAGPPGSGKTVLVSSYIEKKGLPAIWYQVDPGDSDAATFFYYMRLAAQKAVPRKKTRLPLLTPEYIPGIRAFTKRFFEGLYATVKAPFCLVFDNYHEVGGSIFHRIIKDGLEVVPEGVSVIFLSRSGPPAEFTRLRVSGAMEVVDRDELDLTAEEARAITRIKSGPAITKQAASEMHKRTEGWAAGLILMLEQVKNGVAGIEDFKEMTPKAIFDYFLSEIFQNMDDDTRTVLLKTAFLPDMDSRMAEKLTRLPGAGEILSRLNRNNYFTERRFQVNPVYQYHPLFKEFLLAKARESFTGADIMGLLRKAAEILEESAKYEDAFKLLRDAGDWEGVSRLIVSHAGSLVSQGRWAVLETWIRSVPPETLSEDPWLRYWLGACGMQTNPDGARKDFEAAYGIFAGEGTDVAGIFLSWCGAVNTFLYAWRDYHPLDGWIAGFEGLRKRYGEPLPEEIEDNIAACVFGALMFRQPSHPDLPVWEERVKQILHRSKDEVGRMSVGHNLILYYLWTGRNSKAGLVIETLSPAFKGLNAPPLAELMWHFSRALYYYHMASTGTP